MGITRRDFVLGAGAAVGAAAAGLLGFPEPASGANPADPYVTCFYQFTPASLTALGKSGALPDGPGYVHIFTQSTPGEVRHPNTARSVHALGESFLYGPAFDLHKYEGWRTASDAQIKEWAEKFREEALDSSGPADFFAFNEMPVMGSTLPDVRVQVAKICRALHGAGGGPKLRGAAIGKQ